MLDIVILPTIEGAYFRTRFISYLKNNNDEILEDDRC